MIVKLKRDWFGPGGAFYRANEGLHEIPEELRDELPKDAVVVSDKGTLPSPGNQPKPGFGAKPEHEQELDLIPGGAPTHQLTGNANEQPEADMDVDKAEVKEGLKEAQKVEAAKLKTDASKTRINL